MTLPAKDWLKKKTHSKVDARGLTSAEIVTRALKAKERTERAKKKSLNTPCPVDKS
jgi:ribosomal protein L15E